MSATPETTPESDTGIPRSEYDQRLARVRARMADQGLSALLVTDPANLYYLTGYDAWSFYTPQVLVVPAEDDIVLYARHIDAQGAHRTAWLPLEQIVGYPENHIHRPHFHPFDWVAFDMRRRGLVGRIHGVVGLEMDSHFFSPKAYRALVAAIPEWRFVDCFELVNWVRAVKSDREIQLMRTAARVTTKAMEAALGSIGEGVPQNVVAGEIMRAQALGDGDAWGDYPSIVPLLPTGEAADTPHLTWTDRRFRAGDGVLLELAGAHRRYHVPLTRTVVLGEPAPEVVALEQAVADGLQRLLDTARAGVPASRLAEAWTFALAEHGLTKPSRLGYSIGIGYPPDWGERTMSIRSEESTVLEPNMTFHVICSMWISGAGYGVSESVRITETGVETFTSLPRGLIRV
ncbi:Xaa-Pro peptidase family protein [Janibacter alkaliphilus]|uniref:Xaa-Pro dipeptidase n=1 Tax=Janibacter alkaliphilus TaxID=1069963 RepID=A0A852X892_9MICO|nr:M24 family metallopeptidase [Janibacter alkaliphilus]NYG37700.1 Xaa-Pro dipeptidase [Janibacter alkaliphilus]